MALDLQQVNRRPRDRRRISIRNLHFILIAATVCTTGQMRAELPGGFEVPEMWEYTAPLIGPEDREVDPSHAQKDPTVVFHEGKWHVFMTVKLPARSAVEHCSFESWDHAQEATRKVLTVSESDYFYAPQVFCFEPRKKWDLVYQSGMPDAKKMWVAFSTTSDISDPASWTAAQLKQQLRLLEPILPMKR